MLSFIGHFLLIVLIFGVFIFIHELGHFLTARACGVAINEFAIGMGPKIFSRKSNKNGIVYSLRLLPIGGFVSMVGEDEDSDDERALLQRRDRSKVVTHEEHTVEKVFEDKNIIVERDRRYREEQER